MALKSLRALAQAIADVKKEAGDSADHKSLLDALAGVTKVIDNDAESGSSKDDRDSEDDDYSFATAERRHVARNAERSGDDTSGAGDAK